MTVNSLFVTFIFVPSILYFTFCVCFKLFIGLEGFGDLVPVLGPHYSYTSNLNITPYSIIEYFHCCLLLSFILFLIFIVNHIIWYGYLYRSHRLSRWGTRLPRPRQTNPTRQQKRRRVFLIPTPQITHKNIISSLLISKEKEGIMTVGAKIFCCVGECGSPA